MSDWPISIRYEGKPQGKGRPRFGKGNTYTPEKTKLYENDLKWLAKSAMKGRKPLEGPVCMLVQASFKHPTKRGKHASKPDLDNLIKCAKDALNTIAYVDDGQVCWLEAGKFYGSEDYLSISFWPFEESPLTDFPDS